MRGLLAIAPARAPCALLASGCGEAKKAAAAAPARRRSRRCAYPAGLAEAREPDQGARLLPRLAARPADGPDRRPVEQHQLGLAGPQLPRELRLAGDRAAAPRAASCTSTCAATPAGRRSRPAAPAAPTAGTSRASPTRAARSPRTGSPRGSTRSTRTPTRGTRCCSGARTARSTRSPSTSRRRSTFNNVVRYLKRELASLVARSSPTPDEAHAAGRSSSALRPAPSARPGSTSSSTSSPAARRTRAAAATRCPSSTCSTASASCDSDGVEVLVPPLHHEIVTARRRRRPRATCATRRPSSSALLAGARRATTRRRRPGSASRVAWGLPYFDGFVAGCGAAPPAARPPRGQAGAARRASASRATRTTRGSSRTTSRSCCAPTRATHIDDADEAPPRLEALRADVDPPRLRGRRLRRRPVAAEADGASPRRSPAPT